MSRDLSLDDHPVTDLFPRPHTPEQCRMTPIGDAIRNVLGIRYDS